MSTQPKFNVHDKVLANLDFENATSQIKITEQVKAEVCGVGFDPMEGGGSHYHYKIKPEQSNRVMHITEDKLESEPKKCPSGHTFGVDFDDFKDCKDCLVRLVCEECYEKLDSEEEEEEEEDCEEYKKGQHPIISIRDGIGFIRNSLMWNHFKCEIGEAMDLATNNLPVGSEVRTGVKDLSLMFDDVSNMLAKLQDEIIPEELDKQES